MTAVTLLANPLREGWTLTHTGGDAPNGHRQRNGGRGGARLDPR